MRVRELINLTPHDVVIFGSGDEPEVLERIPASGTVAGLASRRMAAHLEVGTMDIPSGTLDYTGEITGLPRPREGVLFVVSRLTAAVAGRDDLVFPDDEVRRDGTVIGCRRLSFTGPWPTTWKAQS